MFTKKRGLVFKLSYYGVELKVLQYYTRLVYTYVYVMCKYHALDKPVKAQDNNIKFMIITVKETLRTEHFLINTSREFDKYAKISQEPKDTCFAFLRSLSIC